MISLAKERGHSTASMAGTFANEIKAKNLILSHFSPRFEGEYDPAVVDPEATSSIDQLVQIAKSKSNCPTFAAEDFMNIELSPRTDNPDTAQTTIRIFQKFR